MSRTLSVVTPENVEVRFELAGLGTRFLAAMLDYMLVGTIVGVVLGTFLALSAATLQLTGTWLIAVCVLMVFCVDWCYFIGFEGFRQGQTPGKRFMALRVLRDGGFPLDMRAAMIRNFLRTVDFLPSLYCAGTVAAFIHPDHKRLGDMAAGTLVVREGRVMREPGAGMMPPAGVFSAEVCRRLTDTQVAALRDYVDRMPSLSVAVREGLGRDMAARISEYLGVSITPAAFPALLADYDSVGR